MRLGISERVDGPMKLLRDDIHASAAREKYFEKQGVAIDRVVVPRLVHGDRVEVVDASAGGTFIADTDALVTSSPETILTVTVADCFPVYFFDPVKEVVGIAHAGWRGVVKEVAPKMIDVFVNRFGSKQADIEVKIGPGICEKHFEISENIRGGFDQDVVVEREGKVFVDLARMIKKQLQAAGVERIDFVHECTYEHPDKYYSYRAEKLCDDERMVAWIGFRDVS